jgi:uncharacterized Zn finger protein
MRYSTTAITSVNTSYVRRGKAAMRFYDAYPPYVSVGERRAKAEKKLQQLRKKHPNLKPVIIAGNALATTWWGKSWNSNLERYADYSNRIGRGRSYVRHRAVLDLRLTPGNITALVQGSDTQPYRVAITVALLHADNWSTIRTTCAGRFDSLSELLGGTFPQALKDLFFARGAGLFPSPQDIHFDCSCPDWASMCKHVAAALYGVGARLDDDPGLFFTLRGITVEDIITQTVADTTQTLLHKAERPSANVLDDVDLGDVFGIQFDTVHVPDPARPPVQPKSSTPTRNTVPTQKTRATKTHTLAGKTSAGQRLSSPPPKAVLTVRPAKPVVLPTRPQGTMLDTLIEALGKARKGKSLAQLQEKLGWTKVQLRNALSRAVSKGRVEMLTPGVYRHKG